MDVTEILSPEDEEDISLQESIKVFEAYVRTGGLVRSQVQSYNHFIVTIVHEIIASINPVIYPSPSGNVEVYFENLIFRKPKYKNSSQEFRDSQNLFPHECRDRNVSYSAQMFIDMIVKSPNSDSPAHYDHFKQIPMGEMPVMIRSELCNTKDMTTDELYAAKEDPMDEGGYFVIAGKKGNIGERVLINQERLACNKIYIFRRRKKTPKYTHYAEIRSSANNTCSSLLQIGIIDKKISVIIQWVPEKNAIPLGIVFLALGICKDNIHNYILHKSQKSNANLLIPTLEQLHEFCDGIDGDNYQNAALEFIGKMGKKFIKDYDDEEEDAEKDEQKRLTSENAIGYATHLLNTNLLPHLGIDYNKKALFLGYMTNRLLKFIISPETAILAQDRDHYANKRIQTSGELMATLFHSSFTKASKDMKKSCETRAASGGRSVKPPDFFKSKIFTDGLVGSLTNNKWGHLKGAGISQIYDRFNPQMALSLRRRLSVPIAAEGKVIPPRRLHASSYGFVCISETPEGKHVGLTKNMTLGTYVTVGSSSEPIVDILLGLHNSIMEEGDYNVGICKIEDMKSDALSHTKVFVNGSWDCITDAPRSIMRRLRELKASDQLNYDTSIVYEELCNEIRIFTDMGRLVRPLYVVKDGRLLITREDIRKLERGDIVWHDLVSTGKIEIINAEEQNCPFILIATTPNKLREKPVKPYTHCEIHPILIYGAAAALIPFSSNNQCIHENELVIMHNGTSKKIKDVNIGDLVITFDPNNQTQSITKVVAKCHAPTKKPMYTITTASGRKITATYDHKFMTAGGWKRVEELEITDFSNPVPQSLIGISLEPCPVSTEIEENIILDKEKFIKRARLAHIRESLIKSHVQNLLDLGLLPLKSTDLRLISLSRLFGMCLTDGSVFISSGIPRMSSDFGSLYGAEQFEKDVEILGLKPHKPKFLQKMFHGSLHSTWKVEHGSYIPSLLIASGFNPGKKTTQKYSELPDWITKGSQIVKREFLSSFQGGDGCRIRYNRTKAGFGFVIAETSKQVTEEHKDSLITMMSQIVVMLREFGVEVGNAGFRKYTRREDRITVYYKISNKQKNLMVYFDRIGYRYDDAKIVNSGLAVEYIRFIDIIRKERIALYNDIILRRSKGILPSQISKDIDIDVDIRIVRNILGNKNRTPSLPILKNTPRSMENWRDIVSSSSTTLFVPIAKIEKSRETMIADITTESTNQSFLCGDMFCVHNSPRNCYSCSMTKQAIGIPGLNFMERNCEIQYVLHYPQKPIISTQVSEILGYHDMPCGQNVIVAIMPYRGFNQEDSIAINKASAERGLFNTSSYVNHSVQLRPFDREKEILGIPDRDLCHDITGRVNSILCTDKSINDGSSEDHEEIRMDMKSYTEVIKRVKHGEPSNVPYAVAKIGSIVERGDVVIGVLKYIPEDDRTPQQRPYRNHSIVFNHHDRGQVIKVIYGRDGGGFFFVNVKIVCVRELEIGDKYSSRHGQLAVVQA